MGNQGSAPHEPLQAAVNAGFSLRGTSFRRTSSRGMDRLRRSFRESFRRRKGDGSGINGGAGPESARPHQWQSDEVSVRGGTCVFNVKYLGCVEVFESRGMQVCEEALKVLRNSRRRAVRAVLHVSGDGLRVVEEDTKGLIVDQTIEKVSFCAPDRNHERGFSYICRDGTTRRWMCHGFLATRDPGERLSHAVGCAFAACLERKQRRDKDTLVAAELNKSHASKIIANGVNQVNKPERSMSIDSNASTISSIMSNSTVPPVIPAAARPPPPPNPFAIERPHAAPHMLERQGSFRGFSHLNNNSPFKRQMSLRISDLPSNLERLRPHPSSLPLQSQQSQPPVAPLIPLSPLASEPPPVEPEDQVAAMCQQLARGLQLLSEEPVTVPPIVPVSAPQDLPAPDQWLGRIARGPPPVTRAPPLSRARSLGGDPFDAEWAAPPRPTNPFLQQAM